MYTWLLFAIPNLVYMWQLFDDGYRLVLWLFNPHLTFSSQNSETLLELSSGALLFSITMKCWWGESMWGSPCHCCYHWKPHLNMTGEVLQVCPEAWRLTEVFWKHLWGHFWSPHLNFMFFTWLPSPRSLIFAQIFQNSKHLWSQTFHIRDTQPVVVTTKNYRWYIATEHTVLVCSDHMVDRWPFWKFSSNSLIHIPAWFG